MSAGAPACGGGLSNPAIYLSFYLSIHVSIYLSIYSSIYLLWSAVRGLEVNLRLRTSRRCSRPITAVLGGQNLVGKLKSNLKF